MRPAGPSPGGGRGLLSPGAHRGLRTGWGAAPTPAGCAARTPRTTDLSPRERLPAQIHTVRASRFPALSRDPSASTRPAPMALRTLNAGRAMTTLLEPGFVTPLLLDVFEILRNDKLRSTHGGGKGEKEATDLKANPPLSRCPCSGTPAGTRRTPRAAA